jgi:hypothetical protein
MADWSDAPPTAQELGATGSNWDKLPPNKDELSDSSQILKNAYIPEAQYSRVDKITPENIQTAAENAGNEATLGHLPQTEAAVQTGIDRVKNWAQGERVTPNSYVNYRDANIRRIQQESADNPASAMIGKGIGIAGQVAITPEVRALEATGPVGAFLKNTAKGGLMGAGYGALSNPGDTQGQVDPMQLGDRAKNAVQGAKFGSVVGGGAGVLSIPMSAIRNSADVAADVANGQAVKAMGGTLRDIRSLDNQGRLDDIGHYALDNGIVEAGDSVDDIAKKASVAKDEAGQKLGKLYDDATLATMAQNKDAQNEAYRTTFKKTYDENMQNIDQSQFYPKRATGVVQNIKDALMPEATQRQNAKVILDAADKSKNLAWNNAKTAAQKAAQDASDSAVAQSNIHAFNPTRDAPEILQKVQDSMGNAVDKKNGVKVVSDYLDQLQQDHGDKALDPFEAHDVKNNLDKQIKWTADPRVNQPAQQQALRIMRNHVADAIDNHISALGDATGDPGIANRLRDANRDYGFSSSIADMANDRALRNQANRTIGLTDTISGGAGAATGAAMSHNPVVAAGMAAGSALGNKAARTYGNSVLASSANTASKVLPFTGINQLGMLGQAATSPEVTQGLIANKMNPTPSLKKKKEDQ